VSLNINKALAFRLPRWPHGCVHFSRGGPSYNIWRVDTDGGNLKQLTWGSSDFTPSCSQDSKWVVFDSGPER
jgi:Tol biopolymer transport system component